MKIADLQNLQNDLIRKALEGSLFGADYSAAPITKLTGADSSLQELPDGWWDWGLMTDDGQAFSREIDLSEVTSFSRYQPTRSDVNSDVDSLEVSLQETNIHTISMTAGVSEADLTPDPASGELQVKKPTRPNRRFWRNLALAVDVFNGQEIYIGRFLPRTSITDYGDSAFAKGDDPILWPATFRGENDDTLGYAKNDMFGGPGWKALLTKMGFGGVANAPAWVATNAYDQDDTAKLTGGAILQAGNAGTSGATEPVPPAVGATVEDGDITWTRLS